MQRFVIPTLVLQANPEDAVTLMRLGVLANALLAVASMSAGALARGVGERRDGPQAILLSASYLKEVMEVID